MYYLVDDELDTSHALSRYSRLFSSTVDSYDRMQRQCQNEFAFCCHEMVTVGWTNRWWAPYIYWYHTVPVQHECDCRYGAHVRCIYL